MWKCCDLKVHLTQAWPIKGIFIKADSNCAEPNWQFGQYEALSCKTSIINKLMNITLRYPAAGWGVLHIYLTPGAQSPPKILCTAQGCAAGFKMGSNSASWTTHGTWEWEALVSKQDHPRREKQLTEFWNH